ncbi:MAG: hypothetical protein AAGG75_25455 [Bacteroidota bacterium]
MKNDDTFDQELYEKIDRYLDGEMEGEERTVFEKAIQTDVKLAQQLAKSKQARLSIELGRRKELKDKLTARGEELLRNSSIKVEEPPKQKNWLFFLMILMLLAMMAFFFFGPKFTQQTISQPPQPVALYEKYIDWYQRSTTLSNEPDSSDQAVMLDSAEQYYLSRDCSAALPLLQELQKTPPVASLNYLLSGLCLLHNDQPGVARSQFSRIPSTATDFYWHGQWYTALAWLKEGKTAEATTVLESFAPIRHKQKQKADELLKVLKQ